MSNPTFSPDQINQIVAIDAITNNNQAAVASGSSPATAPSNQSQVIFSKNSMVLLVSIMVIYAILYSLFRLFLGERVSIGYKGIFIDMLAVILVLYLIINYNTMYFSSSTDPFGAFLVWMRNYADNLSNVFLTVLLIIFLYLFLYVLQVPMEPEERPYSMVIINGLIWAFFFLQLFNVLCMVMFGFSFADAILDPFIQGWYSLPGATSPGSTPPPLNGGNQPASNQLIIQDPSGFMHWLENGGLDNVKGRQNISNAIPTTQPVQLSLPQNYYNCKSTPGPSVDDGSEVFNITNNLYTYDDANAICQAFGARLATYDEVEAAYNDGGEWCNYGWSADQMALFPTQKETWQRLQRTATHKNDCGRPGVNGGYMDNPNLKFGVNCYGVKPDYQSKDVSGVKIHTNTKAISNEEQARIDYWKQHMDQLQLNSFNFSNWTEYWLPETAPTQAPVQAQPSAQTVSTTNIPTGSGSVVPTVVPQTVTSATSNPSSST
jgi:Extracellular link domain